MWWMPNMTEDLKNFIKWLWDAIQAMLAQPLSFTEMPIVQYLFGNAAGLSYKIVMYVFIAVICFAIVFKKMRTNGAIASINLLAAAVVIPLWFWLADQLFQVGHLLNRVAVAMGQLTTEDPTADDGGRLQIPLLPVQQALVPFFLSLVLAFVGLQLLILLVNYAIANVVIVLIGLFAYAAYGLNEGTRKFFSVLISIFVVTGIVGIPVILFSTEIAQFISNALLGEVDNGTWMILFVLAGTLFGLYLQYAIGRAAYKRIDRVVGKVIAKVDDKIRSVTENKERFDTHLRGEQRTTISHRFDQMRVRTVNAGVDKLDTLKIGAAAYITKKIGEYATRVAQPAAKAAAPVIGAAAKAAPLVAAVPHPAAKVVSIGATALSALVNKVGNAPLPRARERSRP